ncbi:hypothetical protein PJM70_10255 [Mycobacterium kansasii]
MSRSPSTVHRWLRRARDHAHLTQLWQRGAQALIRLNADVFNELPGTGQLLRDALTMMAGCWATESSSGHAIEGEKCVPPNAMLSPCQPLRHGLLRPLRPGYGLRWRKKR